MLLVCISFVSCDEEYILSVHGTVVAEPSTIKNGEEVTFSIGGNISNGSGTNRGYIVVSYYIDDSLIVSSKEKKLPYKAKVKIENLTQGEHTLSAKATGSNENVTISSEELIPSKITVIE